MTASDVIVKKVGNWYILSSQETDYVLYISVAAMSRVQAVSEYILDVNNQKRKGEVNNGNGRKKLGHRA